MIANRTRPVVAGLNGAVASAHPLASQVGLQMLQSGGNAVDAVLGMAAALQVVEPYMSGIGGVGLMMVHTADGETRTLNYSGNTPAAAMPDQFNPATQELGPRACLIPGSLAGWFEANRCYGTKSMGEIFAPAIQFATNGFPLHPLNVRIVEQCFERLNDEGKRIFAVPRRIGTIVRQPELAATLRSIVENGPEHFYKGPLGRRITDYLQSQGGLLTEEDLAQYEPEWQEPLGIDFRGRHIKTCPPNCEGFQILQTLKLLEPDDIQARGHNSTDYIHRLSEAIKLAVADRIQWCGDPRFYDIPLDRLLSEDYLSTRRALMNGERASQSEGERWGGNRRADSLPPGRFEGLTTHLSAVDEAGNAASITQSLGDGFGSGVYVPGTGVALNNFVFWTEIDPACPTPSRIHPGRRWSCCMSPLQVFRPDGKFWFSIGTPGSYGILHTTVQMLLNVIEFGADIQLAIEAPRFRLFEGTRMQIEDRVPIRIRDELVARGHDLEPVGDYSMLVGGGQAVMIDCESGARLGGADPRRDGYALAY